MLSKQISNLNSSSNKPKILSLFSGCGGLDLGFHQAGYETVWANDFSHWACESFRKNIGDVIVEGDIEQIDPNNPTIPDCDIILGGFPCQDFSMIWKQPGLEGERGNLYKSFLRFVNAKKPKVFVAENVKGLLTANKKKAIQQIITDFENCGYYVQAKLYNFAEFGVPQFRERVLIVGVRLDTGFDFHHPEPTHGENTDYGLLPYVTAGQAISDIPENANNHEQLKISEQTKKRLNLIPEGGNYSDIPRDHPLYVKSMLSLVYRRMHRDKPSTTIIAAGGGGTWGYHFPEPRAFTNRERARLQSFPDNFEFMGSTTEVRRQIGNAVPPQGVVELAKAILPVFSDGYHKVNLHEKLEAEKNVFFQDRLNKIRGGKR
ncbi:TPA: DNA cytosine methyltransferase [Neisseria meningitidis]|uniref:DNA cytosine methyltransferase n=1 Tax=Neisseria meningitidis TaxID=487 RepID=UPI00016103A2|nr:DNA cytosine methyltransferase [Neisseria meningitidis]ABX72940.1 site-specific DNA-methyltransferase M.NgoVII [Neisseria meningitidis 053442]MCG3357208.1 DNA cytosine methyltransferase [Neisseria meningitidis]MCL4975522.1 DNA cytosine methyltransferase [Neisseria meningitidis]MCL4981714.1 DNA cytosine methyltransferase [Neisseria meningitidis]MCL4985828.1 DNA cytosine methyltransferase [Neisseria meningitidis]